MYCKSSKPSSENETRKCWRTSLFRIAERSRSAQPEPRRMRYLGTLDRSPTRHLYFAGNRTFLLCSDKLNCLRNFFRTGRTAYRSPWQNGIAERWVGTVRRELLDHVIVIDEQHLRRLLREYVDYYNEDRVHTQLRDSPTGRPIEDRPSRDAQIVALPRVGGLHHRYVWRDAA